MPRTLRPHLPGNAFHITARTQNRNRWFTENVRDDVVEIICEAIECSTTELIAYSVMPNHIHLIVRQGAQPLGWFMQRVLQRTALLVRNKVRPDGQGHIFGSRYWSGLLDDASYLRQAIIYTHLNARYAGLCDAPEDYPWSSHPSYSGISQDTREKPLLVEHGLALFASDRSNISSRENYLEFVRYWMVRKKLPLGWKFILADDELPNAPRAHAGDAAWFAEYSHAINNGLGKTVRTNEDVQDRAIAALRMIDRELTLYDLRSCGRVKALGEVRRAVIARLVLESHRNSAIARCLNVSPAHVSVIAADLRATGEKGLISGIAESVAQKP